jgi:hypothetical protein
MTSAKVIVTATIYLGVLWTLAHVRVANREFRNRNEIRSWITHSTLLYISIVVIALLAGVSGIFNRFDRFPPPIMIFFVYMIALSFFLGFSKFGTLLVKHLTISELIGFQSFRILAELALFLGLREGRTPIQLTFEGYNFDIITGISAVFLGVLFRSRNLLNLAFAWNTVGLGFLLVVMFIANTSLPTPLRIFMNEPSNIWVTQFPYILLPGILVVSALTGHLLTFRKIKSLTTGFN